MKTILFGCGAALLVAVAVLTFLPVLHAQGSNAPCFQAYFPAPINKFGFVTLPLDRSIFVDVNGVLRVAPPPLPPILVMPPVEVKEEGGMVTADTATFTLQFDPIAGSIAIYLNGVRLSVAMDHYTVTGRVVTLAAPALAGMGVFFDYKHL